MIRFNIIFPLISRPLFFWVSHQNPLCIPLLPMHATVPANLTLPYFFVLIIFDEKQKLWNSLLCSFCQPPVISSFLANILLSTCSQIPSVELGISAIINLCELVYIHFIWFVLLRFFLPPYLSITTFSYNMQHLPVVRVEWSALLLPVLEALLLPSATTPDHRSKVFLNLLGQVLW
jgi:hypothetical protein